MKLKSTNIIAFDIGSNKIAALAANISKQGNAYVAAQIIRSSLGFRSGAITDLESAEESFVSCIYDLENEIDRSINRVSLTLSGAGTKSFFVSHKIKLGNAAVTKSDVKKLVLKALAEFKIADMDVIHYFPIEFVIDEENIVDNPLGLYGTTLSCQLHIIAANAVMMLNLTKCLARCQVEVKNVTSAVYAAGIATLSEDEKTLGSIIVDLGSHTTSFAVFYEGECIYVGSVPLGSFHVTSDIARVFSVGIATAEKLKILHGTVDHEFLHRNELIRLEDYEDLTNYETDTSITSQDLSKIIENRLEEIFHGIKAQYDNLHMDNIIARRMVITGGGSSMHGLANLLGRKFNKQVRVAKPQIIDGFLENNNANIYASALGLIHLETGKYSKTKNNIIGEDRGWMKRTISWLRENI